jgi:hypothetical protein
MVKRGADCFISKNSGNHLLRERMIFMGRHEQNRNINDIKVDNKSCLNSSQISDLHHNVQNYGHFKFSLHNSCKQFCSLVCTYFLKCIHVPPCSLLILLNVLSSLKCSMFINPICSYFNQFSVKWDISKCWGPIAIREVNSNNLFLSFAHYDGELIFVNSLNTFSNSIISHQSQPLFFNVKIPL